MITSEQRTLFFAGAAGALLTGVFLHFAGAGFIAYNAAQLATFAGSLPFAGLAALAVLAVARNVPDRLFGAAVFFCAFGYFFAGYQGYLDPFTMEGDNLCQIAYWKILFRPELSGSVGAAFTKPGHLVLLGLLHQLAGSFGPVVFKAGWCLAMAACVWTLARVATDVGGRLAGVAALPVATAVFLIEFLAGSATIVLVPLLLLGLRFYLVKPERLVWGRLLLVLSLHVHIFGIAALAVAGLVRLARREWREAAVLALWSTLSLALWVAVITRIQGSLARLNSGAAAGYAGPVDGIAGSKADYILGVFRAELTGDPGLLLPLVLGVLGVAGALCFGHRAYLALLAIFGVLLANLWLLSGTLNIHRFFAAFYGLGCSVGVGSLAACLAQARRQAKPLSLALAALAIVALFASLDYALLGYYRQLGPASAGSIFASDYLRSAGVLLADRALPPSPRLMTEDDLLYPVIVRAPDRYPALTALQAFNVAPESGRRELLAKIDYIWIALDDRHPYYYLSHLPVPAWNDDPFRRLVLDLLASGRSKTLYGFTFEPVAANDDRLVIRVLPSPVAAPRS